MTLHFKCLVSIKTDTYYRRVTERFNNNLSFNMVKTNRSTLHTVYNIQQSATQGSNDTAHTLSRRTAAGNQV